MSKSTLNLATCQQVLNQASYFATSPIRLIRAAGFRRQRAFPIPILVYHRIADRKTDEWTIACDRFEEQIEWLQGRFELISLEQAQSRIRATTSQRPALCLTFDGGYADNHLFALPLLIRRGIPFAYFVDAHSVINDDRSVDPKLRQNGAMSDDCDSLRDLVHCEVEIGLQLPAGGVNGLSDDRLHEEMEIRANDLEHRIEAIVRFIACPHSIGNRLDPRVFQIAHDLRRAGVCSAYGGVNAVEGDGFHLQRIPAVSETWRLKKLLGWNRSGWQ